MKKHRRSSRGMTFTETLVALAIVSILGVAMTNGMNAAVQVYRNASVSSEAQTLCTTILTALSDEYRFASQVNTVDDAVVINSDTFGFGVTVTADSDTGHILIGGMELLSDAAYTSGLKAGVATGLAGNIVTIHVWVGSDLEKPYADQTVRVEALNKK